MWQRDIKKTIFTLNIGMEYAPELTQYTYPLMKYFADKIGAKIVYITERKFPTWPVTYEKFQIYELAKKYESDWYWYLDSDTLIHPEMPDITNYLIKHTVCHNGKDHANIRWKYDRFFLRDSRHIGSANWCTLASDWCIDLWKPLDDLTLEEALANIKPVVEELNSVVTAEHLIDDYVASRNIAKFGLKVKTIQEIYHELEWPKELCFFQHQYLMTLEKKLEHFHKVLRGYTDEQGKLQEGWKLPKGLIKDLPD